jgi:flagellin
MTQVRPGGPASGTTAGDTFIATKTIATLANSLTLTEQSGHLMHSPSEGANATTNTLTTDIEAVQAKINTARVQAGSQYAALESAVSFTTDLTAQYELGFNTVNDVNFSMETAHLAKNQILQQAATAMLAQANQGQQGLLQLIQN